MSPILSCTQIRSLRYSSSAGAVFVSLCTSRPSGRNCCPMIWFLRAERSQWHLRVSMLSQFMFAICQLNYRMKPSSPPSPPMARYTPSVMAISHLRNGNRLIFNVCLQPDPVLVKRAWFCLSYLAPWPTCPLYYLWRIWSSASGVSPLGPVPALQAARSCGPWVCGPLLLFLFPMILFLMTLFLILILFLFLLLVPRMIFSILCFDFHIVTPYDVIST